MPGNSLVQYCWCCPHIATTLLCSKYVPREIERCSKRGDWVFLSLNPRGEGREREGVSLSPKTRYSTVTALLCGDCWMLDTYHFSLLPTAAHALGALYLLLRCTGISTSNQFMASSEGERKKPLSPLSVAILIPPHFLDW